MDKLMSYYRLTKPGIIRGNIMVAAAGFLFASKGNIDFTRAIWLLIGTSAIIAAACTYNNIYDRRLDAHMKRTQNRALVSGAISVRHAFIFAAVLLAFGVGVLARFVNTTTLLVGIVGFIDYVFVYTPLKTRTHHATFLGGISGATPPVAGYVAVTNSLDSTALLLFLVLLCWQMPHFFAIALFRRDEYKAAHVPIHPLVKGALATKIQILAYTVAFLLSSVLLYRIGNLSKTFVVVMSATSIYWLWYGLKSFASQDIVRWAKGMFGISLLILLTFSIVLALNYWLP
jgi:heme o synthase